MRQSSDGVGSQELIELPDNLGGELLAVELGLDGREDALLPELLPHLYSELLLALRHALRLAHMNFQRRKRVHALPM